MPLRKLPASEGPSRVATPVTRVDLGGLDLVSNQPRGLSATKRTGHAVELPFRALTLGCSARSSAPNSHWRNPGRKRPDGTHFPDPHGCSQKLVRPPVRGQTLVSKLTSEGWLADSYCFFNDFKYSTTAFTSSALSLSL
jgi:hypothetical protein